MIAVLGSYADQHATFMDKEVVESIANWIKLQRQ